MYYLFQRSDPVLMQSALHSRYWGGEMSRSRLGLTFISVCAYRSAQMARLATPSRVCARSLGR
jgi:hypothetical protein